MKDQIKRLDENQLTELSNELKMAVSQHLEWMNNLVMGLVSNEFSAHEQLVSVNAHEQCYFGKWLLRVKNLKHIQNQLLDNIEQTHKELHRITKHLVEHRVFEPTRQNETDLNTLAALQSTWSTMIGQTLDFFEEIVVYQHQFDPLTGLVNRRVAHSILKEENQDIQQGQSSYCIAIGDLDKFKLINDRLGHDCGDYVLSECANVIKNNCRDIDVVCRYGGEEFLLLLPNIHMSEAIKALERIRESIAQAKLSCGGEEVRITISFGVSKLTADTTIEEAIKHADAALYQAKNTGRNKVCKSEKAINSR